MSREIVFGVGAFVLGAIIAISALAGGIGPSFALLLGVLLLADGVLRLTNLPPRR